MVKVAILGSKVIGMNELVADKLKQLDIKIETVLLTSADLENDDYDGLICVSMYDLTDFELMIDNNEYSKYNMIITGTVIKGDTFGADKKISDYDDSIVWRNKLDYKDALVEFSKIMIP